MTFHACVGFAFAAFAAAAFVALATAYAQIIRVFDKA